MKKRTRFLAVLLTLVLMVSAFPTGGIAFTASALRVSADRDYTIGCALDYGALFDDAYIIIPELTATDSVSYTYCGRAVTEQYSGVRHFSTVAAAAEHYLENGGAPIFYLTAGNYSAGRIALPDGAILLGANAGKTPNDPYLNFDLPDVTKGWSAAERFDETVITGGISAGGSVTVDGISYSGTAAFMTVADSDADKADDHSVTVQNTVISDITGDSLFFDTSLSNDTYSYDLKDCRITNTSCTDTFSQNTRYIHTDGVYFFHNSGPFIECLSGFSSAELDIDLYRTYLFENSGEKYPIYARYTDGDHKSHITIDKMLWYESTSLDFGIMTFFSTPNSVNSEYKIDIINSTFLADGSYNPDCEANTFINGNQDLYQLGLYKLNVNNNRIIGFDSMFANVNDTARVHADYNNNYFAPTFSGVGDTLGTRSKYYIHTDKTVGSTPYNNIDYARTELLNYYKDYAMTLSDKTFYVSGISFYDDVDYVSINNGDGCVTVGMREGTVTAPSLIFENSAVSGTFYSDAAHTVKCNKFSAPARGAVDTYYCYALCGSTELVIPVYVYGEDAIPYFADSYTDKTGALKNTAYLLAPDAKSGDISAEFDGSTYLFTVGKNAFATVDEILAACDGVPQIILPYGKYENIVINGECEIYGQNFRSGAYTSINSECIRGLDWLSGKTASLSGTVINSDNVKLLGVTFTDSVSVFGSCDIRNSSFTGYAQLSLDDTVTDVYISGIGVETKAAALITGALPASVTADSSYFKNGTAVTDRKWHVQNYDSKCEFTVSGCRFDNVSKTVVGDVRTGSSADDYDISFNVRDSVFNVVNSATAAVCVTPARYSGSGITNCRFVCRSDSGYPVHIGTDSSSDTFSFTGNRFIGFEKISTSSDNYIPDGSLNYFAPYSEGYQTESRGIVIPGGVYCSDYYGDYGKTQVLAAVSGFEFSDRITVTGRALKYICDSKSCDLSGDITASCDVTVTDQSGKICDISALDSPYDTTLYTVSFFNSAAPYSKIDYTLSVVRADSRTLSIECDKAPVIRDDSGIYTLTLPESESGAHLSVTGTDVTLDITDIKEGETRDCILTVDGIDYRLSVTRPLSSGVLLDYDAYVNTAYIIGADIDGTTASFYYRGKTYTQTYDKKRHFDTFDKAYNAFLKTDPDIVRDTPVFIFAPGDYTAPTLRYRAVILGANAGISPIATTVTGASPYTVPEANGLRSVLYTTRFYGTLTRSVGDSSLEKVEYKNDSRLKLYTIVDGIDSVSDTALMSEVGDRRHEIYLQNITARSAAVTGGGKGDITLKNVQIKNAAVCVNNAATDSLTVDGCYITGTGGAATFSRSVSALFSGFGDITLKNSFIMSNSAGITVSSGGDTVIKNNIISDSTALDITAAASLVMNGNTVSGGSTPTVAGGIGAVVENNRFIGYFDIGIDDIGVNYNSANFADDSDVSGRNLGDDWYLDYGMSLKNSDFYISDVAFESGIHSVSIDNAAAFISISLTEGKPETAIFTPNADGITLLVDGRDDFTLTGGNSYTLTLSKGGYTRSFTVSVDYETIPYFTDTDGIGDVKNTAVLIDPTVIALNGEGVVCEWRGQKYKFIYGQNLFFDTAAARLALTGHIQAMLTAYDYDREFVLRPDMSLYGVNFDVDPNIKSDTLGDDWAKNPDWGKYGQTEILNITVPPETEGTLIEIYGITLRGRIYDGTRPASKLCTEFNMINTVIEHEEWQTTIYGGTSYMYTITLTNSNSTSGENNIDRGMIKNMRVEKLRVNPEVTANKNRLLNERLPGDFTVDGLYLDMAKADCSLIGWMKMSDYQQNGRITYKNCNIRNSMSVNSSLTLAFEGRNHAVNKSGQTAVLTVDNCTFYNTQKVQYGLQIAPNAYSSINITNNLILSTTKPSKAPIFFVSVTAGSDITDTFNLKYNRFIGTRYYVSFQYSSSTCTSDLSYNYYSSSYTENYKNGTSGTKLSGTGVSCATYYLDYDMHFLNGGLSPYAFGNGMVADYKYKKLTLALNLSDGDTFSLYDYITNTGSNRFAVSGVSNITAIPISAGSNIFTVTVNNYDTYILTVTATSAADELSALIEKAQKITEADSFEYYTSDTAKELKDALVYSQVVKESGSSEDKLSKAAARLKAALEALTVDKTALNRLIASLPDADDYTAVSYAKLTKAADTAGASSDDITADELVALMKDITDARDSLIDISEYYTALDTARGVTNDGTYSDAAYSAFAAEIEKIAQSADIVTYADMLRNIVSINTAYDLLQTDRVALDRAIAQAQALTEDSCTAAIYKKVASALKSALNITDSSTQAQIDSAYTALNSTLLSVVDATEFNKALSQAKAMTNDGRYSSEVWSDFVAAIENIEAKSKNYTTADHLAQGTNAIALAVASLTTDISALESALKKAAAVKRADYTSASLAAFDIAYKNAQNISAHPTQAIIDKSVSDLTSALKDLVKKSTLSAKVAKMLEITNADGKYCASSYTAFVNKVKAFKASIDGVATAAAAKKFVSDLDSARSLLKTHVYTYTRNGDATCISAGTETGRCSNCSKTVKRNSTGALKSHSYGRYTSNGDATYISDGTKSAYCTVCGHKNTVADVGSKPALIDTTKVFRDVERGKWYVDAINYCYSNNFISGMSNTEFGISTPVTRGMFITVLARIAGVDTNNNNVKTKFTDVKRGKYYTNAIKWANENGIVSGLSETTFGPDTAIQRQQLCVMIVNFAGFCDVEIGTVEKAVKFSDAATIANYAKDAVAVCQKADIVNGYESGSKVYFRPTNTATRAEAAQILYKFHQNYFA